MLTKRNLFIFHPYSKVKGSSFGRVQGNQVGLNPNFGPFPE